MKSSQIAKFQSFIGSLLPAGLLSVMLMAALLVAGQRAQGQGANLPEVPPSLQVPEGSVLKFHTYAMGLQIYVWMVDAAGGRWVFQAPEAVLFASEQNRGVVGEHYAGPTWESNSGSKVVGARVAGVTMDPTAIPWLLLRAVSSQGPGVFNRVTFIQRLTTVGGLAPATPGMTPGEVARVPYLAEYFFYEGGEL